MDVRSNAVSVRPAQAAGLHVSLHERALALWPWLDRGQLRRCAGDPHRMAAVISRHTALPHSAILARLLGTSVSRHEADLWFG